MYLLLVWDLLNFNLSCLFITQCSQNGTFTDLSPRSNFCLERIFKPCSDMWPSLRCHISTDSSSFDVTHASASYNVSPLSMNRLAPIFSAFINTSVPLTIFIISFSTWVLYSWLSICPKDQRLFLKPLACRTSSIVRTLPSNNLFWLYQYQWSPKHDHHPYIQILLRWFICVEPFSPRGHVSGGSWVCKPDVI